MDEEIKKRLYATLWHIGGMAAVVLLTFLVDPKVIEGLGLPQYAVVLFGILLSQATKYFNSPK